MRRRNRTPDARTYLPNSNVNIYEEPLPDVIDKRWKIGNMIGTGSFSDVYEVKHVRRGTRGALKVEPTSVGFEALRKENEIYNALAAQGHSSGFAKLLYYGSQRKFNFLIMSRLGFSLKRYWDEYSRRLSASTALMVGEQLVTRIKHLHAAGYYHGDIGLGNIMTGRSDRDKIYLIDFGVSEALPSRATASYRRRDLQSLGSELVRIFKGHVPVLSSRNAVPSSEQIVDHIRSVCREIPELATYFEKVYAKDFSRESHYESLRNIFKDGLRNRNPRRSAKFEWVR